MTDVQAYEPNELIVSVIPIFTFFFIHNDANTSFPLTRTLVIYNVIPPCRIHPVIIATAFASQASNVQPTYTDGNWSASNLSIHPRDIDH